MINLIPLDSPAIITLGIENASRTIQGRELDNLTLKNAHMIGSKPRPEGQSKSIQEMQTLTNEPSYTAID
jgi:hypothetical protein